MERMHQEIAIDPGVVRAKAYEIWQSLGCPDGAAEQTWYEAERQLLSRTVQPKTESATTAASVASEAPMAADKVAADKVAADKVAVDRASSAPPTMSTGQSISSAPPPASEVTSKGKKSPSGSKRTVRR